jgi:hypothetical protein
MNRSVLALATFTVALALVPACKHDDGSAQTTVITSARDAPQAGVEAIDPASGRQAAWVMAGQLCRHEAACNRIATSGTDEAKLLAEQVCVTNAAASVRRSMNAWACTPAQVRARYEECLAAIRSESCEIMTDALERVPVCRASVICGQ